MRKKVLIGNWKMNLTVEKSIDLVQNIKDTQNVVVVLTPSYTALESVQIEIEDREFLKLGAQNMHFEDSGQFTGEISPVMLKEVGCEYVILGHSERRTKFGESDDLINKKVLSALRNKINPILCIGESLAEKESGKTKEVLSDQLKTDLKDVSDISNLIIAYEPVWAIGTGIVPTPAYIEEVHQEIRNELELKFGVEVAKQVPIIYGGSANKDNVDDILKTNEVDGFILGGASLDADIFNIIAWKLSQ